MEPNSVDFAIQTLRKCSGLRGWDRRTKCMWPTLTRESPCEAWGFSLMVGGDIGESCAHWSGIVSHRHDKGIWIKVASVREGSPADLAGIKSRDFITRINGQIVFHLTVADVQRIITNSGTTLHIDIERDSARSLLYDGGVYATPLNFLYNDISNQINYKTRRFC